MQGTLGGTIVEMHHGTTLLWRARIYICVASTGMQRLHVHALKSLHKITQARRQFEMEAAGTGADRAAQVRTTIFHLIRDWCGNLPQPC